MVSSGQLIWVHSVQPAVHKRRTKLNHAKTKPYLNKVQKQCFSVLRSNEFTFLLRKHGRCVLKRRRIIQFVISPQRQGLHLIWYGGTLVLMELAACTAGNVPSVVKGLFKFYSNISSHPLSFSGRALHISARQRKAAYCSFYNRILYQTRTGKQHSQKSSSCSPQSQTFTDCCEKKRGWP